jgi:hypothetical protein
MTQSATDIFSSARLGPLADVDVVAGVNTLGQSPWTSLVLLSVLLLTVFALFVWFIAHGESWDQRRLRLWQRHPAQGAGRRETDFLEATTHGPFRQKPSRP